MTGKGHPKKYDNPYPTQSKEGKRWRYLVVKKGVTPEDAAEQAKSPGRGFAKKREEGGKCGKKPAALVKKGLVEPGKPRKPAQVQRNGDGAVAVSGEDLLENPNVPDHVKDQLKKEMHAPSRDSGVSRVEQDKGITSHQPHTDAPQRPNTFHQPQPLSTHEITLKLTPATSGESLTVLTRIADGIEHQNAILLKLLEVQERGLPVAVEKPLCSQVRSSPPTLVAAVDPEPRSANGLIVGDRVRLLELDGTPTKKVGHVTRVLPGRNECEVKFEGIGGGSRQTFWIERLQVVGEAS